MDNPQPLEKQEIHKYVIKKIYLKMDNPQPLKKKENNNSLRKREN